MRCRRKTQDSTRKSVLMAWCASVLSAWSCSVTLRVTAAPPTRRWTSGPVDPRLTVGGSPRTEHSIAPPAAVRPRAVVVYFDNDVKVYAPMDAIS